MVGALAMALGIAGCQSTPVPEGESNATPEAAYAPLTHTQLLAHGKPEGVSVTANGLRSAVLSWSKPFENTYRYRIERSENADGPFAWLADVDPEKLSYTDGDSPASRLRDSAAYYYRMRTLFDKNGVMSEPTQPVKTVTAPPPVPPASVKLEATGSRAVTVTWPLSVSEGVTGYRIERTDAAHADAFEKTGDVREPPFVDGGTPASTLKDSTKYLYRVVSVNRVDSESAPSAPAEVTTFPPPAAPLKPAAVSSEVRCVPLTWEASPESDVVRYDIYQARAAEGPFTKISEVAGRTATSFTDGGGNPGNLEDEGTYFYRIRAVNSVTAESADSATVRAVTREVPPEVKGVVATGARPREVPLSWSLSEDKAVIGYEVWRATVGEDDWQQIARLTSRDITSHLDRGGEKDGTRLGLLKDGTEYEYKVIAFNTANVRSSASGLVKARTKLIPVVPAGLTATTGEARTIRLKWQPNPEKDVNCYVVEYAKKPTETFRRLTVVRAVEGGALAADDTNLEPNVTRYYRIKALDREGLEGDWCEPVLGSSKPVPDKPTDFQTRAEANAIILTWKPPAQPDVQQYKIWSSRLLGWDLVATVDRPEYRFDLADHPKALTIAVSALDADKLESEKSEKVKIDPQAK